MRLTRSFFFTFVLLAAACGGTFSSDEAPLDGPGANTPGDGKDIPTLPGDTASDAGTDASLPEVVTLAVDFDHPRGVAVDDAWVYFAVTGSRGQGIYRAGKDGREPEKLDQGAAVGRARVIAVDATHVFYSVPNLTGDSTIARVAKGGGVPEVMLTATYSNAGVGDGKDLYLVDAPQSGDTTGAIVRVAEQCAVPCTATVVTVGQTLPVDVALAEGNVFWTNIDKKETLAYPGGPVIGTEWLGTVHGVAKSTEGSAATTGTIADKLEDPTYLTVTGGFVYFTVASRNKLYRMRTVGGAPEEAVKSTGGRVGGLVSDAAHVFYTVASKEGGYRIMALAVGADVPVELATAQGSPIGMALDDKRIYWANYQGGEIRSQLKP